MKQSKKTKDSGILKGKILKTPKVKIAPVSASKFISSLPGSTYTKEERSNFHKELERERNSW